MAVVPSAPAPYTTTFDPGAGGLRVMAWNETRPRVGQDRDLVGDVVGDGDRHRGVRRQRFGEAAGGLGGVAGVDAGREAAVVEVAADRVVAPLARRAQRA